MKRSWQRRLALVGAPMMALIVGCGVASADFPAAGQVSEPADSTAASKETPAEESCIKFDDSGTQLWHGEFSDRVQQMGAELSALASRHSDWVMGGVYCSDRQGIATFLKPGSGEVEQLLADVAADYPELTVELRYVPRSMDEVMELVDKVTAAGLDEAGLAGIGPDVYNGGILLSVRGYGDAAGEPADRLVARAEAAVTAIIGHDVPITSTVEEGEAVDAYH
jgi:hypothetical protein